MLHFLSVCSATWAALSARPGTGSKSKLPAKSALSSSSTGSKGELLLVSPAPACVVSASHYLDLQHIILRQMLSSTGLLLCISACSRQHKKPRVLAKFMQQQALQAAERKLASAAAIAAQGQPAAASACSHQLLLPCSWVLQMPHLRLYSISSLLVQQLHQNVKMVLLPERRRCWGLMMKGMMNPQSMSWKSSCQKCTQLLQKAMRMWTWGPAPLRQLSWARWGGIDLSHPAFVPGYVPALVTPQAVTTFGSNSAAYDPAEVVRRRLAAPSSVLQLQQQQLQQLQMDTVTQQIVAGCGGNQQQAATAFGSNIVRSSSSSSSSSRRGPCLSPPLPSGVLLHRQVLHSRCRLSQYLQQTERCYCSSTSSSSSSNDNNRVTCSNRSNSCCAACSSYSTCSEQPQQLNK